MLHRSRGQRVGLSATTLLFRVVGVPTNADECLEAGQSNLPRHSARFLLGLWDM